MLDFQLVLPAYNEAKNLSPLIHRAVSAAKEAGFSHDRFQLVLVNNGSTDNTAEILNELSAGDLGQWFTVVKVMPNQGYGYGILMGLKNTVAPIVGWSHADLQCNPSDVFKGYAEIKSEKDWENIFLKGTRSGRNIKDIVVSRTFEFLAFAILGLKINEMNAQPKLFHRSLLTQIQSPPLGFGFDLYVLYHAAKAKKKFKTISVAFPPRIHGTSKWAKNFFSRYKTILGMIAFMLKLLKSEGRVRC